MNLKLNLVLLILFLIIFPVSTLAQFPAALDVTSLNGENGLTLEGANSAEHSGFSVSFAGDINNDGLDDILIGAPDADPNGNSSGEVYLVYGNSNFGFSTVFLSGLNGTNGLTFTGEAAGDQAGWSVAATGDINDDSLNEILIGAPQASPNNVTNAGITYVVYSSFAPFSTIFLSGLTGKTTGFAIDGIAEGDNSGWSVNTVGDVNNDGKADIIIGAPYADSMGVDAGDSYVYYGNTTVFDHVFLSGLDVGRGFTLNGVAAGDHAGWSVGSVGDFNGDQLNEILIGAPNASSVGPGDGDSYVFYSGYPLFNSLFLSALDGSNGYAINGALAGENSGTSISSIGDINGDNIDDLFIGAPNANSNGVNSGNGYVLFGGTSIFNSVFLSGLDGTNGYVVVGANETDNTGMTVSPAGDINADGIGDLLIGAPNASPNGDESGAAYVVFGGVHGFSSLYLAGLDGTLGFKINGESAGNHFGSSVSKAGDFNGDGLDDFIIGAPDAGKSYIVFGDDTIFKNGYED
jgi:hypothetical protein